MVSHEEVGGIRFANAAVNFGCAWLTGFGALSFMVSVLPIFVGVPQLLISGVQQN